MENMKKSAEQYIELMNAVPDFLEFTYFDLLQDRKILINEQVTTNLIEKVAIQILRFNKEDEDKGISVNERKPIEILIATEGGDVLTGIHLIDLIKKSKTPVHTIAMNMACSMGALLLIAGHKRFAYENSTVLIHDGSLHLNSSSRKAKQTMEYYDRLEQRLKDVIVNNTKITEEMYDAKSDEEWYIFGDEALELGIVDELL